MAQSFAEAFERFEAGIGSSTELMMAATNDRELAMAANVIAHHHLQRNDGFTHAANTLTGAVMRVTDPIVSARLRIDMAMIYNGQGHRSYARTLVERGIETLGDLASEAAASVRTDLKTMHEALAPA
ncbi:MAG TPA: hypothetical protein VG964_03110 [Candidatus Saccharimonadales bacterium]|nr:hypothetical protein [Candidatus Saccharimonadales bacterium]